MKTAFFDAFSGLSGDMVVGALLDAGADFSCLQTAIAALALQDYRLSIHAKTASGIVATKFDVEVSQPQPERHLAEITGLIRRSGLAPEVVEKAVAVFDALAAAEARVHRTTPDRVHFHEVGAVDSIIDIVAAAWALTELQIDAIYVSPLPMGRGYAHSRHGTIPIPAPATIELLENFPVRLGDGAGEMVTPTGAAIVRALAKPAPQHLDFVAERVAYGAGSKDFSDRPNLLRLLVGRENSPLESDSMLEITVNIDDLNPQMYPHLVERLLGVGARDVTITPTIMKKGRPGIVVAVLAEPALRDEIAAILFAETTTIGLRFHPVERLKLKRQLVDVATRYGVIRVKFAGDPPSNFAPEFEDCRRAAETHHTPLRNVLAEAAARARDMLS